MEHINFYVTFSGILWFVAMAFLNSMAFGKASWKNNLFRPRELSVYLSLIKTETDVLKKKRLRLYLFLTIFTLANFIVQAILDILERTK